MLNDSERNAAQLAISRYGVNPVVIQTVVRSVLEARARGESMDLFQAFVNEKVLSPHQINDIRLGLDKTQIDLQTEKSKNGIQFRNLPDQHPGDTDQVPELRTLGDYRILRRLGEGGMGAVFLGYHEKENRQVALKVLSAQSAKNQSILDRFLREASSGKILNHPNIVRNFGESQDQATGLHYMVLEYIDGPNVHDMLVQRERFSVGDALYIILDVARALEHVHSRNIVHRDIKPGNILITSSGMAKLSDLGLAKRTDEASNLTHARQGFGTPYYMPYEQAMNAKQANSCSDIYALGATLYHLLTGEVPFPGANSLEIVERKSTGFFTPASKLQPDIPSVIDDILAKMLARNPKDRYQTASELIVEIERTGLASPVLSFVKLESALQDPIVRKRLISPAQPTQPDLHLARPKPDAITHQPAPGRKDTPKPASKPKPRNPQTEKPIPPIPPPLNWTLIVVFVCVVIIGFFAGFFLMVR